MLGAPGAGRLPRVSACPSSTAAIERYLAEAFPEHRLPADFVDLIHARTEGNPLFMVDLLRDLRDRRVIAQDAGPLGARRLGPGPGPRAAGVGRGA